MTAPVELERVFPKIKALLDKTVANGCTEFEAESAARKAQELLQKYNIELDQIQPKMSNGVVELPIDFFGLKVKQQWMIDLAAVIADASFCKLLIAGGRRPLMWFVGLKENTDAAEYLYNQLGDRLGWIVYERTGKYTAEFKEKYGYSPVQAGGRHSPKAWRTSWLVGAVQRIGETLRNQKANFANANDNNMAIVLKRDSQIDDYIAEKYPRLGTHTRSEGSFNSNAYHTGYEEAADIAINPALGG